MRHYALYLTCALLVYCAPQTNVQLAEENASAPHGYPVCTIGDTAANQSNLESLPEANACPLKRGKDYSLVSDSAIAGYNVEIEGCISSAYVDAFAIFYGHDIDNNIVCGEAINISNISDSHPDCDDCQFAYEIAHSTVYGDTLRECPSVTVSEWWSFMGYSSLFKALYLYDDSIGWQTFFVEEEQSGFDGESVYFSYSLE